MYKSVMLLLLEIVFITTVLQAGYAEKEIDPASHSVKNFIPIVMVKSCATYSMNEEKNGKSYSNRFDTYFRHLRFGAKGEVYPGLSYSFMFHYDQLGEDAYAATKGSDKGLGLWNAMISARIFKTSDLLFVHTGYYWAAISREYNTSPWAVSSYDKAYSVWYLRNFLTAKGNGIESGIGLGGLLNTDHNFGLSYRLSVHNPDKHNSPGHSNPLVSGRVMLSIGDPEQAKYKFMLSGNQWGKRNGLTIGLGGAYQGKTDNELTDSDHVFFDRSYAYGADVLFNIYGLRIDGEYFIMKREADTYDDFDGTEWHIRIAYDFNIHGYFLEPAFMVASYDGEGEQALYKYIGDDITYDFGLNWYIAKDKTKLALHYVVQDGTVSSNKGEYVGFSLQLKV